MQLSLTATMPLRIPFCESRGLHVVMELLPSGPQCEYIPVLPYQSKIQYDQVYTVDTEAFGSLQSFCSVDETSSSILDALVAPHQDTHGRT